MLNKLYINGTYFDCDGGTLFDKELTIMVSLEKHTLDEFKTTVESGTEPILILRQNPIDPEEWVIVSRFTGFVYLQGAKIEYDHTFTDQSVGTLLRAIITQKPLSETVAQNATDITDIQMAVAELAEMIVGE